VANHSRSQSKSAGALRQPGSNKFVVTPLFYHSTRRPSGEFTDNRGMHWGKFQGGIKLGSVAVW
jgi:hypothetical protein